MARAKTIKNVYDTKTDTFTFDGLYQQVLGSPEKTGAWIVYGREKHGKTWLAVKIADYLSQFAKTLYISAEEGLGADFKKTLQRAKISSQNKSLQFMERIELDELSVKLKKQRPPKIIVIDNLTVYRESLRGSAFQSFLNEHPNKLFIFLAHEKNKEPFTAAAVLCKILAKIVIRVEGLACEVSGRCPGGRLMINEEKAMLYHGSEVAHG